MKLPLNYSQKKVLSSFFINVAVAWFVAAFVTPEITSELNILTLFRYLANMILALFLALLFLKEEI